MARRHPKGLFLKPVLNMVPRRWVTHSEFFVYKAIMTEQKRIQMLRDRARAVRNIWLFRQCYHQLRQVPGQRDLALKAWMQAWEILQEAKRVYPRLPASLAKKKAA